MKTFNRFAVMMAACMAVTQFAFAEDTAPATSGTDSTGVPHGGRGQRIEHLVQALGLTDQQKTQLQDLFKAHESDFKAIRDDQSLTKEQKREKLKSIMDEIKQQAKSFLTPEQQQKWDQLKEEHPNWHKGGGNSGSPLPSPSPSPIP